MNTKSTEDVFESKCHDGRLIAVQDESVVNFAEAIGACEHQRWRATKKSKVAPDYNTIPDYHALLEGQHRPPVQCWVDPYIASPLNIASLHPLWRVDVKDQCDEERRKRFLSSILVSVNGKFYVKSKATGAWCPRRAKDIMSGWDQGCPNLAIRYRVIQWPPWERPRPIDLSGTSLSRSNVG